MSSALSKFNAGYRFVDLDNLCARKSHLEQLLAGSGLRGTILLAPEGINFTVAGRAAAIQQFRNWLDACPEFHGIELKTSYCDERPFKRLSIKIKAATIPFRVSSSDNRPAESPKLSPTELKQWLDEGRPVVLLDVRNEYEIRHGTFVGAHQLNIGHFRDFAEAADSWTAENQQPTETAHADPEHPGIAITSVRIQGHKGNPQSTRTMDPSRCDMPIVTFCTGGIRCEKGAPYLLQRGWSQVYQLEGGILGYFRDCGGAHYQGDCFVFDDRVALNSHLLPRGTVPCGNCGAPLSSQDQLAPEFVTDRHCPFCFVPGVPGNRAEAISGSDQDSASASETDSPLKTRNARICTLTNPLPGAEPYTNQRHIEVREKFDSLSALDFLHRAFPFVGRNAWQERFKEGYLLRQDQVLTVDTIVHARDVLTHLFPATVEPDVDPSIEVIHEDPAIVVVRKGAPLPVHPCGRYNRNSLIRILNRVYSPQVLRLAHRIDANTSGLVVLTRAPRFARKLQMQFEDRQVAKTYLARVLGHPPESPFSHNAPLSPESLQSGARSVDAHGTPAETRFQFLRNLDSTTSLIEARPITGRTNQIRVHLWDLGFPILGDPMYLPERRIGAKQTILPSEHPLCLHAWKLGFTHPLTDEWVEFESPPPTWVEAGWKHM